MMISQQYTRQIRNNLARRKSKSLESSSVAQAQKYQDIGNVAKRSSHEKRRQWLGKSLHPEQIPLSQMEPELKRAIAQINPDERHYVADDFLKHLEARGLSTHDLEQQLKISTQHASCMNADDVSKLATFTYRVHPDVFQEVLAEQPALVKFLSNPIVTAILKVIAAKWLGNRSYSEDAGFKPASY